MTYDEAKRALVVNYMEKADQALASMRRELAAGAPNFAINRAYYACFYAASSVLLKASQRFVKHSGVRSAVHSYLVQKRDLPKELGSFYDDAFAARGEADYKAEKWFTESEARGYAEQSARFVQAMKQLLE